MQRISLRLKFATLAAGCAIAAAGAAGATTTIITLTGGELEGYFGDATMNGEMTIAPSGTTFDYTIVETFVGGPSYTYTFNSLSDDGEASQLPDTPCIEYGCTGPIPPGPVEFALPYPYEEPIPIGGGLATLQFQDSVYDYAGFGTQTEMTVSSMPEPGAWVMMLVGFGGLGAALRASRRRSVATI